MTARPRFREDFVVPRSLHVWILMTLMTGVRIAGSHSLLIRVYFQITKRETLSSLYRGRGQGMRCPLQRQFVCGAVAWVPLIRRY